MKLITKGLIKKVISMLIVVCLMIGIANIPAYAAATMVTPNKTTDAVLSQPYYTPAQAVKKASTKPKATATKKATKTVSLTTQITNKYGKKGLTALKKVANKMGFALKTVYNTFVKMGVTKAQMDKVCSTLLKLIKKGVSFVSCGSLAVAKYLNINKNFAALQNLAAYISTDVNSFIKTYSNEKVILGTKDSAELEVIKNNGHKNVSYYSLTLQNFMTGLKAGEKAIISIDCYNKKGKNVGGHAVTVVKEKNGRYGVYDILINKGEKIIYTATEFKKFMQGKSAIGKTSTGKTIKRPVYYNTTSGYVRLQPIQYGKIRIITDSKGIAAKNKKQYLLKFNIVSSNSVKLIANKNISLINSLLKKKSLSSIAKNYLKKAKILVNNIKNSKKSNAERYSSLRDALILLNRISKANVSMMSIVQQTVKESSIFSSLKTILKNDKTYKIYTKYGEKGLALMDKISKKTKLNPITIYNQFIKNKVSKGEVINLVAPILEDSSNIFEDMNWWLGVYPNIGNALAAIKKLAKK